MTTTAWPTINELAWLRLDCCLAAHPTRVEDLPENTCLIGAPIPLHHAPITPSRKAFTMGWVSGDGSFEQPVRLVKAVENPIPLWTVESAGQGHVTQRRMYFRVETNLIAELHLPGFPLPLKAQVQDASEGGLRCRIDGLSIDPGEKEFAIDFNLEGKSHSVLAHVVRWNAPKHGYRDVGIEFTSAPRSTLDALRAFVFKTQIEARRRK